MTGIKRKFQEVSIWGNFNLTAMHLKVIRIEKGKNSILSKIYLNNRLICYGLENIPRVKKIPGSTYIPLLTYHLDYNKEGGMNGNYYDRFPELHLGMIEIKDIPGFRYVYIHIGNSHKHTAGSLLVGKKYVFENGDYLLNQSVIAYKKLYGLLVELMMKGEVFCEVTQLRE